MSENTALYELFDAQGKPVPVDSMNADEKVALDKTFAKVLSHGWVGEGVKLYMYTLGRRTAYYTEPFTIDSEYGAFDFQAHSAEHGDVIEPLFAVWSK